MVSQVWFFNRFYWKTRCLTFGWVFDVYGKKQKEKYRAIWTHRLWSYGSCVLARVLSFKPWKNRNIMFSKNLPRMPPGGFCFSRCRSHARACRWCGMRGTVRPEGGSAMVSVVGVEARLLWRLTRASIVRAFSIRWVSSPEGEKHHVSLRCQKPKVVKNIALLKVARFARESGFQRWDWFT